MEYQAPPFFKTGPTPLARLLIFSALSLALLLADARLDYLAPLRQIVAVILYPLQHIASAPASIARRASNYFVTHSSLRADNARLADENFSNTRLLQELKALQAENARLRMLIGARERFGELWRELDDLIAVDVEIGSQASIRRIGVGNHRVEPIIAAFQFDQITHTLTKNHSLLLKC